MGGGIQIFEPVRTMPRGRRWKTLYDGVSVRGEEHRMQECVMFLEGVAASMTSNADFGITLEPEPTNASDPLAVKVVGFWTEKTGWFSRSRHTAHIGYVPRGMAFALSKRMEEGRTIGACLRSIEAGKKGIDIVIDVLAS